MMAEDKLQAEIEALREHERVAAAEAVLAEAEQRLAEARRRAADAEASLVEARQNLPRLLGEAVAGAEVTAGEVVKVHAAVRDAESFAAFLATVARELEAPVAAAREALNEAQHVSLLPVLRRGQDLRIAAGRKADRARLLAAAAGSDERGQAAAAKAMEVAQRDYEHGRELIRLACRQGLRFPRRSYMSEPTWPTTEAAERRFWDRPLTPEEMSDAA